MISFIKLFNLGTSPVGKVEITDVNSIAELRAINTGDNGYNAPLLEDGSIVNVDGYYSQNDGGGGTFIFSAYSVAAHDGGITISPTQGLGRWIRQNITQAVNVRWFGAKGDGVTNDYAAILAAVAYTSEGDKAVYLPVGTYLIGTSLALNGFFKIFGDGLDATKIKYVGAGSALVIADGTGSPTWGFVARDFTVTGANAGAVGITVGGLVGAQRAAQGLFENVRAETFTGAGWRLLSSQGVRYISCNSWYNGTGYLLDAAVGGANRSNLFLGCQATYNTGRGLHIKEDGGSVFTSCIFENNNYEGIHIENIEGYNHGTHDFNNCHVEGNQLAPGVHAVTYAGQMLISNSYVGVQDGAFVNIRAGRWICRAAEANGALLNRLWVASCCVLHIENVRPNAFTYAHGAAVDDANNSTNITQTENYAPFSGAPTSYFPVTDAAFFFWTVAGTVRTNYTCYQFGSNTYFYRTDNLGVLYRVNQLGNGVNGLYGEIFFYNAVGVNKGRWASLTESLILGGDTADASARLQVDATTKGFLPPRMTTTQRDAIAAPASGLMIYNTTTNKLNVRGAAAWEVITSA